MHDYQVMVPEGTIGKWSIRKYTVTPAAAALDALRGMWSGTGRCVPPGMYTQLCHYDTIIMSDTPDEIRDHYPPILRARRIPDAQVLINGLGLGLVANAILLTNPTAHVTIVEIAPEVVQLVGPHYQGLYGARLTLHQADAFTWQPPKGQRYHVVWHDIWPYLCADNLPEMAQLHRKYGRRCDWQGSWGKTLCHRQNRQSRAYLTRRRVFA